MKRRWRQIRPVMWAQIPIVVGAMLFLLPWLMRELRPLSEAVRMARRIPYAEYRVYALANIAAELKRRGM